jgi:hypothetical protein
LTLPLLFRSTFSRYSSLIAFAYKFRLRWSRTQKGLALPGEFTSLTEPDGKLKTTAIAAFLGDSGLYRQKAADCCGKVTIFGLKTVIFS